MLVAGYGVSSPAIFTQSPPQPVAIRLRSDSRAAGALVFDWNRQVARRCERFLSPRAYRLLEISPAFNANHLQKAQCAAILKTVSLAGELNSRKLWNIP
jgi:hypothetical protein